MFIMLSRHLTGFSICSIKRFLIFSGFSDGWAVTLETILLFGFKNFISFSKIELTSILNLYSKQVSRGIWKDYALDSLFDNAVFSVYKHTQDKPMYQIIKNSMKGFRNKPIFFIKKDGEIISKSNDLSIILSNFEKNLSIKKLKKH